MSFDLLLADPNNWPPSGREYIYTGNPLKVFVCSPYQGNVEANLAIAQALGRWVFLEHKAIPIIPHLLFPGMLDDKDPAERALGIDAGHELMRVCSRILIYTQKGKSEGMLQDIEAAIRMGLPGTKKPDLVGVMGKLTIPDQAGRPTCVVCHETFYPPSKPELGWNSHDFAEYHNGHCLTKQVDIR